jgi:hypothetical protein
MKENHIAYKIVYKPDGMECTHHAFEEVHMLDMLVNIQALDKKGIYWIFKQLDGKPQEPLSIIDCEHQRIYFHYSGEVEAMDDVIHKLKQSS